MHTQHCIVIGWWVVGWVAVGGHWPSGKCACRWETLIKDSPTAPVRSNPDLTFCKHQQTKAEGSLQHLTLRIFP